MLRNYFVASDCSCRSRIRSCAIYVDNMQKYEIIHHFDVKRLHLAPFLPGSSITGCVGSATLHQCSGISPCTAHVLFIVAPVSVITRRNSSTSQSLVKLCVNQVFRT